MYLTFCTTLQGTRDPLQNSAKRAASLQKNCSNVSIQYLIAGYFLSFSFGSQVFKSLCLKIQECVAGNCHGPMASPASAPPDLPEAWSIL